MKSIDDPNIKDKNVLVRVDYNVPIKDGKITDDLRIRASIPTINYLLEHGAKQIALISHLGRPDGKPNSEFSLKPVVEILRRLLPNTKIEFSPLPEQNHGLKISKDTKIVLMENLRFDPGEESNSKGFAQSIVDATKSDIFVQDGFAVLHRAHASTDAITRLLPSYMGLLVEKEITNLTKALKEPAHPALLIIGGAKVEDKAPLINELSKKFDQIAVGGKIAADGYNNQDSKIYIADDFDEDSEGRKLDIGPIFTSKIAGLIVDAKTIIWNGLLGYAEDPAYATSSTIVAEMLGEKQDATTIICGGDTTGFVENLIKSHPNLKYSLVSTGGGATLEFLLGKELPGIKALE
ncbi:phosphoglycerate kinase [Candidatus Saccharibacteria bacterium]|nr:phosphoglycerate kinase [Candidatus Saccharibacteria bacterium]